MRRVGSLWNDFISFENLYRGWRRAFRSTKTAEAFSFTFHLERELFLLQDELKNHTYHPGSYRYFTIFEPKERTISVAPFRDRVVHHGLIQTLEPIFERSFIYHSYATRKGKGTHKAIEQAQCFLRKNKWYLKMDVSKYFDNIDHAILNSLLANRIKDSLILALCATIIAQGGDGTRGLPIGNLTSQFWANVYLDVFDHYIKERLGTEAYLRYMDDFCLFSNDKTTLIKLVPVITTFLEDALGLRLKNRATLINTALHGLPFLGVRIWPSLIRIGRQNLKRSLVKVRQRENEYTTEKISYQRYRCSMESLLAHVKHWNTHKLLVKELTCRN